MKKFCLILALILVLCSCGKEPQSEIIPEEPENSVSENSESEENLESEVVPEVEPEIKVESEIETVLLLGTVDGIEIYSNAVETGNTRPDILYGKDGVLNSVIEVPEIEYWITDSEGNLLIEHPFYAIEFSDEIISDWYDDYFKYPRIQGCYKGDWYGYNFIDGSFKLIVSEKSGNFYIDMTGHKYEEAYKNYYPIRYNYGIYSPYYGLSDKEGNIVVEPIFSYIVGIPFEDRITGSTNNGSRNDGYENYETLMDFEGNIICTYSSIHFYSFEDGSYIGIANYIGERGAHVLKDKDGKILEEGQRFIDKDGNVLSPCFDLFSIEEFFEYSTYEEIIINHLEDIIVFTDKNGKEFEIIIKDYICKP